MSFDTKPKPPVDLAGNPIRVGDWLLSEDGHLFQWQTDMLDGVVDEVFAFKIVDPAVVLSMTKPAAYFDTLLNHAGVAARLKEIGRLRREAAWQ